MADYLKNSYSEPNRFSKVLFQKGKNLLDFELNELQDNIRVELYRVGQLSGKNGAADSASFKVTGNSTANVSIGAGTFLVDGLPLHLDAPTSVAIPANTTGSTRTYNVYLALSEQEVADPNLQSELGETTRRTQLMYQFVATTSAVPGNSSLSIWAGGTRYVLLATIAHAASASVVAPSEISDARPILPPYMRSYSWDSGNVPKETLTGNLHVVGTLVADAFSPGNMSLTGNLAVAGTTNLTGLLTANAGAVLTGGFTAAARCYISVPGSGIVSLEVRNSGDGTALHVSEGTSQFDEDITVNGLINGSVAPGAITVPSLMTGSFSSGSPKLCWWIDSQGNTRIAGVVTGLSLVSGSQAHIWADNTLPTGRVVRGAVVGTTSGGQTGLGYAFTDSNKGFWVSSLHINSTDTLNTIFVDLTINPNIPIAP